jgi:hypothetical protein
VVYLENVVRINSPLAILSITLQEIEDGFLYQIDPIINAYIQM